MFKSTTVTAAIATASNFKGMLVVKKSFKNFPIFFIMLSVYASAVKSDQ